MDNHSLVMKILAWALIDIRTASVDENLKAVFAISDFVHVVPLQVEKIIKNGGDYYEVIEYLKERAEIKNMTSWLDNTMNHAMKKEANNAL